MATATALAVVLGFLIFVLLAIVLTGCTIVAISAAYTRTRRKGYLPFSASLVPAVGSVTALALVVAVALFGASIPINPLWLPVGVLVIPALGSVALTFGIVWLLPRRPKRVFGRRRTGRSLVLTGWAVTLGGGIPFAVFLCIALWPHATSVGKVGQITFVACGGFGAFFLLGNALVQRGRFADRQGTLEDVLAKDPRPPVVYMRPFEREAEGFVIGPKAKYGKYQIRFVDTQRTLYVAVTFEEYLANMVRECLGPFVALGSPEDFLSPVGAARTYAKDDSWRKDFDQLARSAAAILVEVGKSQNLKWEFEHIRAEGWHERLFVITPHPTVARGYWRVWSKWTQRLKGTSRASWREFSEGLVELGYDPGPDPGPGAILTFDADAHGVVLMTGADYPQDFVEPISRRVDLLPLPVVSPRDDGAQAPTSAVSTSNVSA